MKKTNICKGKLFTDKKLIFFFPFPNIYFYKIKIIITKFKYFFLRNGGFIKYINITYSKFK